MKVKDALKGVSVELKQSENLYDESDVNICFLSLGSEYHGQDYLVMSKTSAENLLAKPREERMAFLASCEVSYSEDAECYGITMPQSTKVLDTFTF